MGKGRGYGKEVREKGKIDERKRSFEYLNDKTEKGEEGRVQGKIKGRGKEQQDNKCGR